MSTKEDLGQLEGHPFFLAGSRKKDDGSWRKQGK